MVAAQPGGPYKSLSWRLPLSWGEHRFIIPYTSQSLLTAPCSRCNEGRSNARVEAMLTTLPSLFWNNHSTGIFTFNLASVPLSFGGPVSGNQRWRSCPVPSWLNTSASTSSRGWLWVLCARLLARQWCHAISAVSRELRLTQGRCLSPPVAAKPVLPKHIIILKKNKVTSLKTQVKNSTTAKITGIKE